MIGSRGCPVFCASKRGFWCTALLYPDLQNVRSCTGGDWRSGFEYAWQPPDPEPDEARTHLAATHPPGDWSGSRNSKLHGTITADGDRWLAYVRLEDRPGLSPITTVGRFATVDEAQMGDRRGMGV
jgi:hypothetical protein